jgi:hypothetical protein
LPIHAGTSLLVLFFGMLQAEELLVYILLRRWCHNACHYTRKPHGNKTAARRPNT